jgi:hypothetical protein
MWEVLVPLVGEAVLSLGGPVAVARLRDRQAPKKHYRTLERVLADIQRSEEGYSLTLGAELKRVGLTANENKRIREFLESPEGFALIRYVAAECIVNKNPVADTLKGLRLEAASLLELYLGGVPRYAQAATPILVTTLRHVTIDLYRRIDSYDRVAAHELRSQIMAIRATQPIQDMALLHVPPSRRRALVRQSATDMRTSITEYVSALHEQVSSLWIPTLQGDFRVPLSQILISRTISPESPSPLPPSGGLLDALSKRSRIVLLGDPGEGKSTAVEASILDLSSGARARVFDAIPIRVQLRHLARAIERSPEISLTRFMTESAGGDFSCEVHEDTWIYFLHLGRCVVFFDGLDEVLSQETRRSVVRRIESLAARFPLNAFVVTSRNTDYHQSVPMNPSFVTARLDPFTPEDVAGFAESFFTLVRMPGGRNSVSEFMDDTEDLADLRSNALMLGVLCNLFSTGRRMPKNRYDLYSQCAEMLFSFWDETKGLGTTAEDAVNTEQAVRELALQVFESGEEEFREPWLRAFLRTFYLKLPGANGASANRFAESAMSLWRGRKWLIVYSGNDQGEDMYRFTHRTFLEYFAAEQAVYMSRTGRHLFRNLAEYIESGSAAAYCLLSVQSFFATRRDGASDFLQELVASASALQKEEKLGSAYRALSFGIECLAFADRAPAEVRFSVTTQMTKLMASLIPSGEFGDIGALDAGGDEEGAETPVTNLAEASWILNLERLRPADFEEHLLALRSAARSLAAVDVGLPTRVFVNLFYATFAPEWKGHKVSTAVREACLSEFATLGTKSFSSDAGSLAWDRWGVVGGLSVGLQMPPNAIQRLSASELFGPVYPVEMGTTVRVSLACLLCDSILGLDKAPGGLGLHEQSLEALVVQAGVLVRNRGQMHVEGPVRFPQKLAGSMSRERLSPGEVLAVVLILGLTHRSSHGYWAAILAQSAESELRNDLQAAFDFCGFAGVPKDDPGWPARALGRLLPDGRDRVAVLRAWGLGKWARQEEANARG